MFFMFVVLKELWCRVEALLVSYILLSSRGASTAVLAVNHPRSERSKHWWSMRKLGAYKIYVGCFAIPELARLSTAPRDLQIRHLPSIPERLIKIHRSNVVLLQLRLGLIGV